ncbi:RNA methyltransferase [Nitrosomonas oligotropha]|uniref:tRNA (cytidine/uridine-2'-O-)-methyltransferase TrmJ n=1 Tax=Nitrosomonas oligotropha TaxID=42354 RepID=A0A1H8NWC6_9PROT|nr:RNA methyltransferase [Nitrosomonas oligotropha]SDW60728.1 tRNA/rRNA methyltransferase [Nitrosomonas oligotropha]SEO33930.1 tRNA/rRNA methyltransferase [Nitrosomonas oligotropha]
MNTPCPLDNIRIVLSHTSHPGNIGAVARAMKTMGLHSLYLINPKCFPDAEADARAANAIDILQQAKVCAEIDKALENTVLTAAVTARPRELSHTIFDARQGAMELVQQARQQPVALLFGREHSGLTTAEVNKCQAIIHIPANPQYPSLNLASAVQVMAYELRMALTGNPTRPAVSGVTANFNELELLYTHLEQLMIASGFLDPQKPKLLMQRIRRLFARARLEKEEVQILRGILTALGKRW